MNGIFKLSIDQIGGALKISARNIVTRKLDLCWCIKIWNTTILLLKE